MFGDERARASPNSKRSSRGTGICAPLHPHRSLGHTDRALCGDGERQDRAGRVDRHARARVWPRPTQRLSGSGLGCRRYGTARPEGRNQDTARDLMKVPTAAYFGAPTFYALGRSVPRGLREPPSEYKLQRLVRGACRGREARPRAERGARELKQVARREAHVLLVVTCS
jgi:hypothetical protein